MGTPFQTPDMVGPNKAEEYARQIGPPDFCFNPNTGLSDVARANKWTKEQQEKKWLEAWTWVLKKVKKTGGNVYVMKKGGENGHLEGNAQPGEVNVAEVAEMNIVYVGY